MEESSIETNSPEDRHKDAVKMLRRTQLLFIPLSAISLATAYYTLSRHFALINLPPQSWILLLFTLLACWLGPIELMISASSNFDIFSLRFHGIANGTNNQTPGINAQGRCNPFIVKSVFLRAPNTQSHYGIRS